MVDSAREIGSGLARISTAHCFFENKNKNKMTEQEIENIKDGLFPKGKERWIKILVKDRDICLNTFMFNEPDKYEGYEVTSIGIRDEYIPQVQAISDLQDSITELLFNWDADESLADAIIEKFKQAKAELKENVIINSTHNP